MRKLVVWSLVIVAVLIAALSVWRHRFGVPNDYPDIEMQFKYGSIGSDHPLTRGIPYWIWRVLPVMLPPAKIMPDGYKPTNGKSGYEAFGFLTDQHDIATEGIDRPIGFSKRRVFGLDFIGANCAFCHVSTVRMTLVSEPKTILAMPGNTEDPELFFMYLFEAASHPDFTVNNVMNEILRPGRKPDMNFVERIIYRAVVIPRFRHEVLQLKGKFDFVDHTNPDRLPRFGPGRVDTWAAYKRTVIDQPDRIPGIADFPSIWNQKARAGMRLHWDGNTPLLEERNIIASLGVVGTNIEYLDKKRLDRITDWIDGLPAPRYEDWMNGYGNSGLHWELVDRGRGIYRNSCAACHAPDGDRVGRVEPLDAYQHQTDDNRLKAFTPDLAKALNRLGTGIWKLRNFSLQKGYVNTLLDGVWLRAPYLHNGSIPTMRELLNIPERRPSKFCRGNDLYDRDNMGFVSSMLKENGQDSCGPYFLYDTSKPGNGNGGHLYGTDLREADKQALIEYLKTL